jgi:trans-aconitate 2-methyltransferase
MSGSLWSPAQYDKFKDERSQPFYDLAGMVERSTGARVLDLGCGTGALTAWLHEALGASQTVGTDNSGSMLAKSRAFERPGLRFVLEDIEQSLDRGERYDVVFSNAALQWVGGHEALWPRLAALVEEGGQLAVQMPANHDHASHTLAREVALEEPFRSALTGAPRVSPVLPVEAYAVMLRKLGFARQRVELRVYLHALGSADEVVEWTRGTMLTAYEAILPPALFGAFLEAYRARVVAALGDERPHLYPFKRVLMWASRA